MKPPLKAAMVLLLMVVAMAPPAPLRAAERKLGPVTHLPLPRFVSLKASKANVRRGPSLTHRIDWVFQHRNMPLEITAEYGNWRRVRDEDGAGGWVHYALLSGARTVSVEVDTLPLVSEAKKGARVVAKLEQGVIASVLECRPDWCRLDADGYEGWAPKTDLWGVGRDETLN